MIRDLMIILLIITTIILGHVYVQNMLQKNSQELIGKLEKLKEKVNDEDKSNIENIVNEIYESWSEKYDNWAIIIDHGEIDEIQKTVLKVKASISSDDMDEINAQIDECIFLISLIEDKEKLNLKNIF